ncbi:MAG: aminoacyl-tRNA hydrolase [Thermoanaerobaculia bacterium]
MKMIVGLGNPGESYRNTRHNIGFRVVEAFARRFRVEIDRHEKSALTGRGRVAGDSVMLALPQTFMNLSGTAVAKLVRAWLDSPSDLIVVYDDIDLPVAKLRIRENGSAGTHNGMKSILASLDDNGFPRLRFGIRGAGYDQTRDLADYVLADFEPDEEQLVGPAIDRSVDALFTIVRGDLRRAMTEFNREPQEEERQA